MVLGMVQKVLGTASSTLLLQWPRSFVDTTDRPLALKTLVSVFAASQEDGGMTDTPLPRSDHYLTAF